VTRALVPLPFPPDLAIEILSPDQDMERLARGADVLPGFALTLATVFAELRLSGGA
jgi:hypothetical protein